MCLLELNGDGLVPAVLLCPSPPAAAQRRVKTFLGYSPGFSCPEQPMGCFSAAAWPGPLEGLCTAPLKAINLPAPEHGAQT